jgi:hypothetical protein
MNGKRDKKEPPITGGFLLLQISLEQWEPDLHRSIGGKLRMMMNVRRLDVFHWYRIYQKQAELSTLQH